MVADLRVVLAGGGTAGHVNPLLATAAELRRRHGSAELTVLGTATGLETELVPEAGLPLRTIDRVPVPRRPSMELAGLPARLRRAVAQSREIIESARAQAVVGFGGYVAAPAYIAARRLGVPIVVHEQNARPGLANRLGARWAETVAVSFAGTPLRGAELIGLPLRAQITELIDERRAPESSARRRQAGALALGLDPVATTLLVTGGSLGAQRVNTAVAEAATDLLAAGVQVLHLTGAGKDGEVRRALDEAGVAEPAPGRTGYRVLPYLSDMADAYAVADLVLCRSGAGTVSELAALGIPAVYVPLPIGNGEQRRNAAGVVDAGGGLLVADADLDAAWVRGELTPLLADLGRLREMGRSAAAHGITDAATALTDRIERAVARRG